MKHVFITTLKDARIFLARDWVEHHDGHWYVAILRADGCCRIASEKEEYLLNKAREDMTSSERRRLRQEL